jgi:SAM-dependent methyltransferase
MTLLNHLNRLLRQGAGSLRNGLGMRDAASILQACGSSTTIHGTRAALAAAFLHGEGIEIGALHQPLVVPSSVRVKYVDRMTAPDLRRHYAELAAQPLVETDIVDNGELLGTIGDGTQDFVIANHFIEHCQNPLLTVQNLLRVLKPAGVVYMAVPDKRFSFDVDRPCTTIEHLMRDYSEGPGWSKRQHFEEWSRLVHKRDDDRLVEEEVAHLIELDYSIHFHVWGAAEFLEFIVTVHRLFQFETELFLRNGPESIVILRKPVG